MSIEYDQEEEIAITPLEKAIGIALAFVDAFMPFSYNDIGLKSMRQHRAAFRDWARDHSIEFKQIKTPGKRGSQDALFFPFRLDESGQKVMAPMTRRKGKNV